AAVLFAMIVVLVLEALFIFQPAALTIRRETDNLAAANRELQRLSNSDGLTGIANRRLFEDFLGQEWQRAIRQREALTLVMIDVDNFKYYNDTYGHQAGDECLRRVADVLRANVKRTTDLIARYGGEEFVAVLPATDAVGAAEVAESLRAAVEALAIPHTASSVSDVITVSLGAATVFPGPGDSPTDIVAMADQAMYQAKQQGRNRVVQAVAQNGPEKGRKGNG
ncbi:MAG TPA: diguanylate cyclase, partial [Negativicutes bacterium]|nr:diguanylate cyclase [Negativicutes bacterium]